jgi:Transposase DDE domain group 1
MQSNDSPKRVVAEKRLEVAYTDKRVSGWGGLVAFQRFLDRLGVRAVLGRCLPDGRTSPNQTPVVDIALALMTSVVTGGRRFAHVERLRSDEVVRAITGMARVPSAITLTRYFGGFLRSQVEHLGQWLNRFIVGRLRCPMLGSVLDLDSTVFERYGSQEGSLKGHNPRRHGRPSHHPLLAMLAESKVVLNGWLRSGNSGSARGVCAFLAETLALLPETFRLYAVRADSGFFVAEFLDFLEERALPYAIVVRMTRHVQRELVRLQSWRPFGDGLAVAEVPYQAPTWKKPRRVVVVREELQERPDARGRRLFDLPGYTFHAVVTTLEHSPEDVWRFYNDRADCENRIKELKDDFGADGFCLQAFDGTEAVFRLNCFLFNLLADFKRTVTGDEAPRLSTLRTRLLVVGAILGANGRTPVLRLGLRGRLRKAFQHLLDLVDARVDPTAPQSSFQAHLPDLAPLRPWRLRPRHARRTPPWLRLGWSFAN